MLPHIGGLRGASPRESTAAHSDNWPKASCRKEGGGPRRGGERGPRTVRPWGGEPAPFYKEAYPFFATPHSHRMATKNPCIRITTYTP
jgi:hypothetical protein